MILNEAVNFDTQSIFIAVPKTGTTSVCSQLRQKGKALIPNPHLSIMQVRNTLYTYLLIKSLGKNANYPTRDLLTDAEIHAKCRQIFATFFKFASVRNPWARAVSLYFRKEGVQMQEQISFETFCENHLYASDTCRQPTLHKNQLDWLVDEDNNCIMDYIYKVEDFNKAIKEISEYTNGRIRLEYRHANRSSQSKAKIYQDLYTNHTRQLIAKRFEKDIDFFKYTF
ncbi:MAG: sulfotransferase family protein [Moorea sp. SIO2B7]|nr:sulfotransferase family protein [Moorena sp. SIO2B7]